MTEIEFIKDGPAVDSSSRRAKELESARARSFAARVSHPKRKRCNRLAVNDQPRKSGASTHSARSNEEPPLVEDGKGLSSHPAKLLNCAHSIQQRRKQLTVGQASLVMTVSNYLWKTSETRLAYDHWLSVTAPWQAQYHASVGSNFWEVVIPQMAQVFSPVRNVLLALEFIDLPAFPNETLAERRKKTIGFYNEGIRYLCQNSLSLPRICFIIVSILAYLLELRWLRTDQARMHLHSCQRLLADAIQDPKDSKDVSEFLCQIKDTMYYGQNFLRLHSRLQILEKSVEYLYPEYGIDKMPADSLGTCTSLEDYLLRFQKCMDELHALMPSFNVFEALRELNYWDDLIHGLCQQRKIGNTTTTVSFMLSYVYLFLIPYAQDGVFGIHPDSLVWDHILRVFRDQLLRDLIPSERQDVNVVVRLGISTILHFPHKPRHAAEIGLIKSLIASSELTAPGSDNNMILGH